MTDTLIDPALSHTDGDDDDIVAHWARKADIARGAIEGTPVKALCGKLFVPMRDPERYRTCPECQRIYEQRGARSAN